jgi:hypothetical protein
MPRERKSVFLSYAREDREWADELLRFLAPWIRDKRLKLWDDSQIQMGGNWQKEIDGGAAGYQGFPGVRTPRRPWPRMSGPSGRY